jgi:DNA-binding MarR family transcriptional regulator
MAGREKRIRPKKLEGLLGYWLRRAQEASFDAFTDRVGDTRIWPGLFAMMAIIQENPNINQTLLSEATGRDKSTLTPSLRELVAAGFGKRTRNPEDDRS